MNTENNKAIVRTYAETYNRGDFDAITPLMAPGAVVHGVLGSGGMDVALSIWRELHQAFAPNLDIQEMAAEGDVVAVRFQETGTFQAPFRGILPTGKSYTIVAMEWFQLRDGKIVNRWGARDSATILRQVQAAA